MEVAIKRNNGNVHRAAANINVSKSRAARGSVCNVLLSRVWHILAGSRYESGGPLHRSKSLRIAVRVLWVTKIETATTIIATMAFFACRPSLKRFPATATQVQVRMVDETTSTSVVQEFENDFSSASIGSPDLGGCQYW